MSTVNLTKTTVNLSKHEVVNLSKSSDNLKKIMIGLGWAPVDKTGAQYVEKLVQPGLIARLFGAQPTMKKVPVTNLDDIDCDAWVLLMENGRWTGSRKDLVAFFNLKRYVDNSNEIAVQHMGDNLTGSGEGDDEEIMIDLSKLPASCTEILIGVTIYKAQDRGQSFDLVRNTFVRVVDTDSNFEICRFNQEDMSSNPGSTTFIAGKLYKEGKEWQFQAIGEGNKARSIEVAADSFR